MTRAPCPPKLFERLLAKSLPAGIVREDVLSSLTEEFVKRSARDGSSKASWWYRRQVAGVMLHALRVRAGILLPELHGLLKGAGRMSAITLDLKFAWRSVVHAPGPYLIAIVTIALGVGANAAVFSVVNGVILSPLPYPESDRIVRVWPEKRWSGAMLRDVREGSTSFERIAGRLAGSLTLLGEGGPEVLNVPLVTSDYFEVLGTGPALGRVVRPEDEVASEGAVVVLSHALWQTRFGSDPGIVGRSIDLSGSGVERRTVVGVMPRGFQDLFGEVDAWIPWITHREVEGYRGTYGGSAVGQLNRGTTHPQAIADMRRLIPDLRMTHATQFREIRYSPVDVVSLKESIVRDVRLRLLVLLGAVGFVLLIACSNVANLLLARATARRREVGLRLALGADRGRVFRQMLTECLFLGLLGGGLGLAMALASVPLLRSQLSNYLPRAALIELDLGVVAYAAGISLLAGLVFGIVPGLRLSGEDPASVLNEQGRGSSPGLKRGRANNVLVVSEIALSLVLVVGAGLMLKSLARLGAVDPGFRSDGVLSLHFVVPSGQYDESAPRRAFFIQALDAIRAVPGVDGVAMVNGTPLEGGWSGIPYMVQGQEVPEGQSIVAGYREISHQYFDILDIPLVEGRPFSTADNPEAETVVVVNQAFVRRHWPGESPLDRMVLDASGQELARIVGVVGDTHFAGLDEDAVPSLYFSAEQGDWNVNSLLIETTGDPLTLVTPVREAVQRIAPSVPVRNPQLLSDIVSAGAGDARFYARLMGTFASIALFLALIGVYGVMSYAVGQRGREIGVKLALGAPKSAVLSDTMSRGMTPVAFGIGLGLLGAWGTSRFLATLLFEVDATDPWVYAGVAGLIVLTSVLAILVPAVRAMRLDPAIALRVE